jgi:hypothetical protein
MLIPFQYAKHSFIPPFKFSEEEYQEIKSTPNFSKAVVREDWQFFHANYKMQFVLWFVPLIAIWVFANPLKAWLPELAYLAVAVFVIAAMAMSLRYGISAYSLWEVIRKKQKFYGTVKGIADRANSYDDFVEGFKNRNVR